jgi:SH3-like domain-containing protein
MPKIQKFSIYLVVQIFAFFIVMTILYLATSANVVNAADWSYIKTRANLKIDEKISDQSEIKYKQPTKIIFTRVTTKSDSMVADSQLWVQILYYFSITRFGFADVPFNYFVDRSGSIYQGRSGYTGAVPELSNLEGVVLVGYLSNGSDISPEAANSINSFVTDLSKGYGISRDNVSAADLQISKGSGYNVVPDISAVKTTEEGSTQTEVAPKLSKISYTSDGNSSFAQSLSAVLDSVAYTSGDRVALNAKVTKVEFDKPTIAADDTFNTQITVENTDPFPWFLTAKYVYVNTQSGRASSFAVNGVWDSFTKPTHITDTTVFPAQTFSMKFAMQAPTIPGTGVTEKFNLIIDPGVYITGSDFEVKFDVTKGEGKFVKILPTGSDVLNVRSCHFVECTIVTQVPVGQVYRVLSEEGGWYQIKLPDGGSGWVGSLYAQLME